MSNQLPKLDEPKTPLRPTSEPKTPLTPPERIYRELGNFASRKESLLHPSKEGKPSRKCKTPDEEEVIKMIINWRVGTKNTPDQNNSSRQKGEPSSLKKDNVAPDEVVDIIKDYRTTNKINYVQYQESTHNGSLVDKLMTKNYQFSGENKNIPGIYCTTLNDNFKQRLENENRYQDEKKTGEKRPILESLSKWSDLEDEEHRNKAFSEMTKEVWWNKMLGVGPLGLIFFLYVKSKRFSFIVNCLLKIWPDGIDKNEIKVDDNADEVDKFRELFHKGLLSESQRYIARFGCYYDHDLDPDKMVEMLIQAEKENVPDLITAFSDYIRQASNVQISTQSGFSNNFISAFLNLELTRPSIAPLTLPFLQKVRCTPVRILVSIFE
ncbi:hypothetical protein RhiirA5_382492 [Rhizophagus irregularis]|uniref:Uncharacterized protein n=1 Tax=Rhizophagus irregularis TaxID=588596 RepID=A0A2N0P0T8_9GLOM|nr:hypothetical protein RhiirA5_382492 [Rhizophagus irregularis]